MKCKICSKGNYLDIYRVHHGKLTGWFRVIKAMDNKLNRDILHLIKEHLSQAPSLKMAVQVKISKPLVPDEKDNSKDSIDTSASIISSNHLNAPKHGTVIPNRVFVGGISSATTELDLVHLFSNYGNVTGTKIISDRAGVSKGYGFVTFETEDEAKRLQKDGFGRGGYECATPTPMPCTSQVFRHNGITYAFHNGMAFFPQPPQQPVAPATHIEPSPVFQQGASYGAVPQGSPGPSYPYSYVPQGQVYYQAPQYQYPVPQYDGCYETSQVMVADGSLVVPQYYLAPQPAHEIAFFQPAPIHPQEPPPSVQPIIYSSPRTYDPAIVYPTEPKCGPENGMGRHNGGGVVSKEEADSSNNSTSPASISTTTAAASSSNNHYNNNRQARETTPVVSVLKLYKDKKEQPHHPRKRQHPNDEGRRHYHLNNNNPDTTNRNLKYHDQRGVGDSRRTPPPVSYSSSQGHGHGANPNSRPHPTVQVPQFPYYPRQVLAPPANLTSFFPPPPPPTAQPLRSRSYYHRPRYTGSGRGRGKWISKEEEVGNPLTPPITPRSESATPGTNTATQSDDVVQSIKALAI